MTTNFHNIQLTDVQLATIKSALKTAERYFRRKADKAASTRFVSLNVPIRHNKVADEFLETFEWVCGDGDVRNRS